jgi:hypothetical protein
MPIITTRSKDYGFPETSAAVLHVDAADPGLTKEGAPDIFMGPVVLTSLSANFERSSGPIDYFYLKVYDAVDAFDPDLPAGLIEPLWVIPVREYPYGNVLLTFPDGYTFTKGVTLRATRTGGTGTAVGDLSPLGFCDVRLAGRKS